MIVSPPMAPASVWHRLGAACTAFFTPEVGAALAAASGFACCVEADESAAREAEVQGMREGATRFGQTP